MKISRSLAFAVLAALLGACSSGSSSGNVDADLAISGMALYQGVDDSSGIVVALAGPVQASTTTAADGSYSFAKVPPGSYVLVLTPVSAAERELVRTAVVRAGASATVDVALFTPVGDATGTATLAGASDSSGIVVVAPGSASAAVTDSQGNFTLRGLSAGAHDLIASAPGYVSAIDRAVAVAHGGTASAPAMTLAPGSGGQGSISGSIVLAGMSGQPGIPLSLQGPSASAGAVTQADGSFSFSGLPDGQYAITATVHDSLQASETLAVQVANAQALSSPVFDFTPVGAIQGVANLEGALAGNAGITVAAVGAASVAVTDDGGNYLLQQVPVGAFEVVASYPERASATSAPVQVAWGQTVAAPPLSLGPPLDAIGEAQGSATLAGLSDASGVVVALSGPVDAVQLTAADGAFDFTDLVPGDYTLTASAASTREGQETLAFSITAAAPFVAGESFAFTPVGAAQGNVADTSGAPVAGALVLAEGTTTSAVTDAAGAFTLGGLAAGSQIIGASVAGSTAAPVTVTILRGQTVDAGTLTLSVAVQASVPIGGQLSLFGGPFGASGDPGGVSVSWSGVESGSAQVGGDGSWSATVPPGFYSLSFSSTGGPWTETVPSALAFPGSDGLVWEGSLYPLASPLEIEYGQRVVSGESVSPIVTNPAFSGDAVFTLSGGSVSPGGSPEAPGTLAMFHQHQVALVHGAVPDVTTVYLESSSGAQVPQQRPLLQPGPLHSAVYVAGGYAYLALADGSIHPLGVEVNYPWAVEEGSAQPLAAGVNFAAGGTVIALAGIAQDGDPCEGDSLYAVDVRAPDAVSLVGCSSGSSEAGSLVVSPDGAGIWVDWDGYGDGVDTVTQSGCSFALGTCAVEHLAADEDLDDGVSPVFSSDGSAALLTSSAGVLLASSDASSIAQLTSGSSDSFTVYPAAFAGGPDDLAVIAQAYTGEAPPADYLIPFRASASLGAPVASDPSETAEVRELSWNLADIVSEAQSGVPMQPGIPFAPAGNLVFTAGDGSTGAGTIVTVPLASGGAPVTVTTSAYYQDDYSQFPSDLRLETVGGKDYLLFLTGAPAEAQRARAAPDDDSGLTLQVYDVAAQTTTAITGGVGALLPPATYEADDTILQPMATQADWVAWSRASDGECFVARFDTASPAPIDLGAVCDPDEGAAFSLDGTTMMFTIEADADYEPIAMTPLPAVQLTTLDVGASNGLEPLTGTFLRDDSMAFLEAVGGTNTAAPQLVIKLDGSSAAGFSATTLQNPNATPYAMSGIAAAPDSSGLLAYGRNSADTTDQPYLSLDLQTYSASTGQAVDLGNVLALQTARLEAPGASASAGLFPAGLLSDGSGLVLVRAGAQDIDAVDGGEGTLVVSTTRGGSVRMLSRAGASFAIVPGTLEVLGAQQRTAAPWGFQDGVYLLAPPSAAAARAPAGR